MARRRPNEPTANATRGAVLVVVAVVIGLVLLRNGLDTSETFTPSTTDGSTSETDDAASTDGTIVDDGTDSTDSSVSVRTPPEVAVIVLNGSGVQGAAARYSTALANLGYNLTDDDGANATSNVDTTQVLYQTSPADFQAEAAAVAAAIGAPATSLAPLGTPLPGTTNSAVVVVVLGPDLGNREPPTGAGTAGTTTNG